MLLDSGIEVVTTLDVRHLESLGDAVRQITGAPQRETLPDEGLAAVRLAGRLRHGSPDAEIFVRFWPSVEARRPRSCVRSQVVEAGLRVAFVHSGRFPVVAALSG
ncbi:hypothetical protein [Streptomyces sp. NPDC002467]|uniref:hypothetical protein n=1 Tax=Streptomyces sp. NPDC002467 TaxID=3364647 RepID=UPI0036A2C790